MRGLSYSMLSCAQQCYQKYKYLYVENIKADVPDSADLHFGTALHMGLQAILEGEDGVPSFNLYWDSIKDKELKTSRYGWEDLRPMGEIFLTRFERLHARRFTEPVCIEKRLYGELDGIRVEGTPDFIGRYQGVPSVVDFKTAGYAYPKEKILVNEQMPFYAHLAHTQIGYMPEQLVYYVFVKGRDPRIQVQTLVLTPEMLKEKLENVADVCYDLDKRTHFYKNRNACMMGTNKCDFFDKCAVDSSTSNEHSEE